MSTRNEQRKATERLVLTGLLSALVAVLSYLGGFIQIGVASVNISLVPVVIGAAIIGPAAGAWLGAVMGVFFFLSKDAALWFSLSIPGTVITVMLKGILAGLAAGLVYKLLRRFNRYGAVLGAAVICPIVNTGIFLLGCLVFFLEDVSSWAAAEGTALATYFIVGMVGVNFLIEFAANVLLSNAIYSILTIFDKRKK